jgi:hypothetical protein
MPYKVALFIHVVSVLALFTAAGIEITGMVGLRRSATVETVRAWARGTAFLGRVFPISSVVILLSGIFMMVAAWPRNTPWAITALVALVVLAILGGAINGKRLEAIHVAAEAAPAGPVPATLRQQINDPVLWTAVQTMTVGALGIVYLMTVKPGWVASVVCMLIAFAIGVASAQPAWRRKGALMAADDTSAGTPQIV